MLLLQVAYDGRRIACGLLGVPAGQAGSGGGLDSKESPKRQLVGLEVDWDDLERLYDEAGLPPQLPATASRVSVPLYRNGTQIGKATSTTWSPTLKKMIALGSVGSGMAEAGTGLDMELTVDHQRKHVRVAVTKLPFFDPPRKRA